MNEKGVSLNGEGFKGYVNEGSKGVYKSLYLEYI